MALVSVNPANGETLRELREWSPEEIDQTLGRIWEAWQGWRETEVGQRAAMFRSLSEGIRRRKEELARVITLEMGKAITEAFSEIEKCALCCEYYAENGGRYLHPETVVTDAARSYVRFDPLGIVLAVMPWNFPFWQVFRAAVPVMFAGNGVALKHASNVTWCAQTIEGLFAEAGFPENLLRMLQINSGSVEGVIRDERIRGVTLTGSVQAGRAVAELAGRYLKKSVLELGGSDPFIVLEDADLDKAAGVAVAARTMNAGQSCIAAKRFIVVAPVYDRFLSRFREKMAGLVVGDPLDPKTQVGAMASLAFIEELERQVGQSVALGARIVTGGRRMERAGAFFLPTILADAAPGMPCWDQELFGPVATVIRASDEEEAIRIANDTEFGLGASVWTGDLERGERIAARIDSGAVFVNGMVKSDPRLPFGGIKHSGYGRELSVFGLREFVNIKTVWVGA